MKCGLLEAVCLLISDQRRSVKRFEGDNNIRKSFSLFVWNIYRRSLGQHSLNLECRYKNNVSGALQSSVEDTSLLTASRSFLLLTYFVASFCVPKMFKIVVRSTNP